MNTVGARKFLADAKDMLRTYGCGITEESTVLMMLSLPHVHAHSQIPRVIFTMMTSPRCAEVWNTTDELAVVVGDEAVHVFSGKKGNEIVSRLAEEDPNAAEVYADTLLGSNIGESAQPIVSVFYNDNIATYSIYSAKSSRRTAMANSIAPMIQDIYAAFEGRVTGIDGQSAIVGSLVLKDGEAEASVSAPLPAMSAADMVASDEYAPDFVLEFQKRFSAFGKCVGIVIVDDRDEDTKEIFLFNFVEKVIEDQKLSYPDLTDESLVFRPSAPEMN